MKWKVEYITDESSNILVVNEDEDVVGIGFPVKLAEHIVDLHNKAIDVARKESK